MSDRLIVEKGIPIPPLVTKGNRGNKGGIPPNEKYPWRQMDIGDSFFVPAGDEPVFLVSRRMGNAIHHAEERYGSTFTRRTMKGGVRVWRIE
jgi:hypothetical protein